MNALVKKEIRLLLPAWIVALLLALPPVCTRSDDGIPVFLLFFGLTIMALTSFGRETSLNTFSQMLSQPAERTRIWHIKLSVLAVAFLTVFGAWRLATILSWHDYGGNPADPEVSEAVLVAGSLVLVATFTGGLWSTLLLRQLAAAFWLTLLVPATLCGFTAAYLSGKDLNYYVITMLCVILGIYSVGGFLFARWLFFRAQDVGWSGLIIALPEWKMFSARPGTAEEIRTRKPIFALVKKEFQLQQGVFTGVAGLFVLHCGIIVLRTFHHFEKDSAGEILTSIFWMLWLVVPVILGSMAVAEERKLGVMEGQLCLPVSRRVQFVIKGFLTLLLGIFLGSVMPIALETTGLALGGHNQIFEPGNRDGYALFLIGFVGSAVWLSLVSFFASTLAKNFLQAVGFALVTFIGCMMIIPVLTNNHMLFFDSIARNSLLQTFIAVPTIIFTLLWLAYLNFKNFRDGLALWRRNLLGFAGALVFIAVSSAAIYNRVWEVFEPAEPPHGPAKLSVSNPPKINAALREVTVLFPDGRVWLDYVGNYYWYHYNRPWEMLQVALHPMPSSAGPSQFMDGTNWIKVMGNVGLQSDGTLWASQQSASPFQWSSSKLVPWKSYLEFTNVGSETDWQAMAYSGYPLSSVYLLKTNHTLWRWSPQIVVLKNRELGFGKPDQIGTNSDWVEITGNTWARKFDGSVWFISNDRKTGNDEFLRATNLDKVDFRTLSFENSGVAYARADGTLWAGVSLRYGREESETARLLQVGKETNWQAVVVSYHMMVALKNDGSLWQWNSQGSLYQSVDEIAKAPPTRLGINSDWVAVVNGWGGVITLAADGSLWFWPDRKSYDYYGLLMKLPKQPQFLGNVFAKGDRN